MSINLIRNCHDFYSHFKENQNQMYICLILPSSDTHQYICIGITLVYILIYIYIHAYNHEVSAYKFSDKEEARDFLETYLT